MHDFPKHFTSLDAMMDSQSALRHYKAMRQDGLILSYCGTLSHDLMTSLLHLSDTKLKELQANTRKKKNIINILIECLQNAMYHGDVDPALHAPSDNRACLVALAQEPGSYYIYAGNHLTKRSANSLKAKLEAMLPLNADQLHELYLDTLSKGELSDKGGAGLGIMRILRESNQQIAYSIRPVDDDTSFFSLQVKITA